MVDKNGTQTGTVKKYIDSGQESERWSEEER